MTQAELTTDELYCIATEVDITGRSDMKKAELREALKEEAPHLLQPFSAVEDIEPGTEVSMNHLSSNLTVTEVKRWDGDELTVETEDDTEVEESAITPHTVVIMETNRGGRHALVANKAAGEGIPSPTKNGDQPHLRRWRAGDQEWMNNSTDPVFIRPITEDGEE